MFCVLFILLFFFLIKYKERISYLDDERVLYTVCKTTNYRNPGKGTPIIEYLFYYKKTIQSENYYNINTSNLNKRDLKYYVGKKYFVKFSIEKPNYSKIYLDKPVPDDFVYTNGQTWDRIPVNYD